MIVAAEIVKQCKRWCCNNVGCVIDLCASVWVHVVVFVFFTLTDRASININKTSLRFLGKLGGFGSGNSTEDGMRREIIIPGLLKPPARQSPEKPRICCL